MEGVAGDGFCEGDDGPVEAAGDGAGEGDGFELEVEAVVALFPGPVGVAAPEEAVVGGGVVVGVELGDVGAAREAVGVGGVEAGEGDVVGGVEVDREDVVLVEAEGGEDGVGGLGEDVGFGDLRGVDVRVGREVAEEGFEIGGGGVGGEGGGSPMVEEGCGCGLLRGEVFDEEIAGAEAGVGVGIFGRGEEEVAGAVLEGEAGFGGGDVGVEGGGVGGVGSSA